MKWMHIALSLSLSPSLSRLITGAFTCQFSVCFYSHRTLTNPQPMRVVMPTGTASAQIIQTQIMPQAMLKQGTVITFKLTPIFHTKRRLLNPISYANCGFYTNIKSIRTVYFYFIFFF